jgi:hypothetical protein
MNQTDMQADEHSVSGQKRLQLNLDLTTPRFNDPLDLTTPWDRFGWFYLK